MRIKFLAIAAAPLLLSACGGGGGSSAMTPMEEVPETLLEKVPDAPLLETISTSFDLTDINRTSESTAGADLPTSGTASYTGAATLLNVDVVTDEFLYVAVGSSSVEVDFASGEIEAAADNFFEVTNLAEIDEQGAVDADFVEGEAITGSFAVEVAQVAVGQNDYLGNASGSVTALNGNIVGFFGTDNADADFEAGTDYIDVDAFEITNGIQTELDIFAGRD